MQESRPFEKNLISAYEEMLSYETLWALKDLKEPDLRDFFKRGGYIPSQALMEAVKTQLCRAENINTLKKTVNMFLTQLLSSRVFFSVTVNGSIQYPRNLTVAQYPLGLLYYKGQLDLINTKSISVIGTRTPSEKGVKNTKKLVQDLVSKGFTIISGLAKGIDTIAHQSTLKNKGRTIGVIGTPIDKYYPQENKLLQDQIAKEYLLISQVPFYRYKTEPFKHHAHHFPRRNKVMATLSLATVVMDISEETLGSQVQARECLRQNKKLFIHESLFHNPKIRWPAQYEKKGAVRIKTAEDIISCLGKDVYVSEIYNQNSNLAQISMI